MNYIRNNYSCQWIKHFGKFLLQIENKFSDSQFNKVTIVSNFTTNFKPCLENLYFKNVHDWKIYPSINKLTKSKNFKSQNLIQKERCLKHININYYTNRIWNHKSNYGSYYKNFFIIRNYSSKVGSIGNVNIPSLKAKKRIQRKKRNVDEENEEEDAEEFQISGPHRFLTFDPDFAIPAIADHKKTIREFQIVAYATADEYDLESLSKGFHKQGLYVETPVIHSSGIGNLHYNKPQNPENVLHLSAAYQVSCESRTMHIFRDGVIVFWNVQNLERLNVLKFIQKYQSGSYDEEIVHEEAETLIYSYTDSSTRLRSSQNLILLNEKGEKELEKFTFSNALAMSVKLGIWEASLDKYVESIEYVTEELQKSGVVALSQEQVLQKLGQLFALRHLINLSSDLLDTPDFYWDHENLEQHYNKMANHLNIQKRTSVMNIKLNHCVELMELLKSHLNDRHSARLEWIIIILIMVEVFFEVLHFL